MGTPPRRRRLAAALCLQAFVAFAVAAGAETISGRIEVLTADDFERGRAETITTLVTGDGKRVVLELPPDAPALATGARVTLEGEARAGAFRVASVASLELPLPEAPDISGTTSVIVILIKFLDTTVEPYTVAQAQGVVLGATNSAAAYYAEASYGSHTLAGIVTNWLTARINRPTTCDYIAVSTEAEYAAQQAGYNPGGYQKHMYVFPHIPCGWAGLGGGSTAWINEALNVLVTGHELGHCFGLGHASSLDCGALPIGGTCTFSEYGDRFSIMGNSSTRHFHAYHKNQLNYLPAGTVATHTAGSTVYTLSPIESPGGLLYAVKIPLTSPQRTYWLEFRQPIGFDSGIGANPANGTLVHVAPDPGYGCGACLLDMTPATAGFTDAALEVGQSFTDPIAGLRVTPLSVDPLALAVQVELGPPPPFGVDRHAAGGSANLNGILEPGETASVEPSFSNTTGGPLTVTGTATDFTGPGGAAYAITDSTADYGMVPDAGLSRCADVTGDCHAVSVSNPSPRPAAHWDTSFEETLSTSAVRTWPLHVGKSFGDTPPTRPDYASVETVFHFGITSGCGGGMFCPDGQVSRAQMAVFLLKAKHGMLYAPPPATGQVFGDVPLGSFAAAWIEQLAAEGITAGCGSGVNYCPGAPVTRAQMAVFLLKTRNGSAFTPPPPIGIFGDVPISSPFAAWVEEMYDQGITAGCGGGLYCPTNPTRRGQMAVFQTKTFGLLLYGP